MNAAGTGEVLFQTKDLQYQANNENLKRAYQSVFHNNKELKTVPFTLNVGAGKIITKIILKKIIRSYKLLMLMLNLIIKL